VSYVDTLNELQSLDLDLYHFLTTLDKIRMSKGAVSYLTTMSIRLYYIHKVLKDTGTFYLHCDPTMSHYLKLVCDLIFNERNFRNEIVWCYRGGGRSHNDFARKHDIILRYSKTENYRFYDKDIRIDYEARDFGKGHDSVWGKHKGSNKVYGWNEGGKIPEDWWRIDQLNSGADERLGYPTQKPEELLERIIKSSSDEGDLVADFFCGCGTTIASAQKLKRNWLGVDISHLAIKLIIDRLTKPYKEHRAKIIRDNIEVTGFPKDVDSAKMLARESDNGRFGFQDWIVEVMLGGIANPKKVADGGFDGYIPYNKGDKKKGLIVIEVKSGKVNVKNIREFIQVVNKQEADMGIFVCFKEYVTAPMMSEAKHQGYLEPERYKSTYDKIQILTVENLLDGEGIKFPFKLYQEETFKKATKKDFAINTTDNLFKEE